MRCFSFRDPSCGAIALFWDPWVSPGFHFRGNPEDGLLVLSIHFVLPAQASHWDTQMPGFQSLDYTLDGAIPVIGNLTGRPGYSNVSHRIGNDRTHFLDDTLPRCRVHKLCYFRYRTLFNDTGADIVRHHFHSSLYRPFVTA
jgi:hypothetical protein